MKRKSIVLMIMAVLFSFYLYGEGIKINTNDLKVKNITIKSGLSGAKEVRMFTDFNGRHYLLGYYQGNKIKIIPITDSTYLSLSLRTNNMKSELVREARVPFIIYEFFSSETYANIFMGIYDRYGINNASLNVTTFPVMTAVGIIAPFIYTSNHEISYGELIHSFTSNVYLGGVGFITNYLISGQFEPLTTFLSALSGNIAGYWMAKKKRYSPGQALIYDEILQKTTYISLTASTVYQASPNSVSSKIVAGSFLGATAVGAVSSYMLANKYKDIKAGDIFLLDGLSNSVSFSMAIITSLITGNIRVILPVSYAMFIPGYYLGYNVLKSGHINAQDGVLFDLGIYAGYLLGGAIDALLITNTGYSSLIGTAVGGMTSTFIMYRWIRGRTSENVTDTKITFDFNPLPNITFNKVRKEYEYSFNHLITIKF